MSDSLTDRPSAKEVFTAALRLADPARRQALIDQACGQDAALRARVEGLLAAVQPTSGNPLDAIVEAFGPEQTVNTATVLQAPRDEFQRREIGPYKLLEQIGEGAFGTVYMAEQSVPLRRKVAVKILKPGMDSKEILARFEAERQALAMMDHPNIARVLDAGTTAEGHPYFVMELVRGIPVTEYCDEARLTTDERLALFIDICRAVQHAHQKGIIHRDLKPSNVLVTMHDDKAVPKVIDFGIAKALTQPLTNHTLFTGYQQMLGTPLYMSPEQAQMSGIDVDTRSDVYSLGVMFYELLTGTTPFDRASLSNAGFDDLRRIIREQEPPRPSTRLTTLDASARSTAAHRRRVDQRKVSDELRGELDWIVMKALEKDRNRRYESASALAEDIQRHLNDQPVEACPPTVGYKLKKFGRRNKGLLTTVALIVLTLLVATGISVVYAVQADRSRSEATANRERAEQSYTKMLQAFDRLLTKVGYETLLDASELESMRREILQDALQMFEGIRAEHPDDPIICSAVASAFLRIGDVNARHDADQVRHCYQSAEQLLKDLTTEHPGNLQYRLDLADTYCRLSWHVDQTDVDSLRHRHLAIEIFEGLLKDPSLIDREGSAPAPPRHPLNRSAAFLLSTGPLDRRVVATKLAEMYRIEGDYLRSMGRLKEAREWIDKSLESATQEAADADTVAGALAASASWHTASGNQQAALADLGNSLDAIQTGLDTRPKSHWYRETMMQCCLQRADLLEAAGRFEAALVDRLKSFELAEFLLRNQPSQRERLPNAGTQLFALLRQRLPRDVSLRVAQDLVERFPATAGSHALLADLIGAGDDRDHALVQLSELVARFPAIADYHLQRALLFMQNGSDEEAIAELSIALALKPDHVRTRITLAKAFRDRGDRAKALLHYDAAIDHVLRSEQSAWYRNYQAALLCCISGYNDRYRQHCRTVLEEFASSDDQNAKHFVGWTCALAPGAIDDHGPAIELARAVVDRDSTNRQFMTGLGALLMRDGQCEEAKRILAKALAAADIEAISTSYIHYFLALTEQHLGNGAAALEQLDLANKIAEQELAAAPMWNRQLTLELLRAEAESLISNALPENKTDPRPPAPPLPTWSR